MTDPNRFEADEGRIEYQGTVIYRVGNRPLIPAELWSDDRLDFKIGLEPVDNDLSGVPDDLRTTLAKHGYWPERD